MKKYLVISFLILSPQILQAVPLSLTGSCNLTNMIPGQAECMINYQIQDDFITPSIERRATGAWVINLVSLTSQADADQFSVRARSKGVHTEQQNVTVKGKKYWRVQITGFVTSEEAKSHSNSAKQKLGLKDVWIMKR